MEEKLTPPEPLELKVKIKIKKFRIPLVLLTITLLSLIILALIHGFLSKSPNSERFRQEKFSLNNQSSNQDESNRLSNGRCKGDGKPKLAHLPMNLEDFSMIIPYGLVVGDHVTPIDHQYFSPTVFRSPKDTYEVYAMADSQIVNIEKHPTRIRLVFSVSCKLFYYYDLLTSVEEFVDPKNVPIQVKAGQRIGRIGGQTLDFAVWDMDVKLSGFVNPDSYSEEPWKIHTADPLDYYTDSLKQKILSKYLRTIPPVSGKIDYDIDGKLVGNWFLKGTPGYKGLKEKRIDGYSSTHFSIAPNHLDPSIYMVSFGDYNGNFSQFATKDGPDPKEVGVGEGFVKFPLYSFGYTKNDGSMWDGFSLTKDPKLTTQRVEGCVGFQLIEKGELKLEAFPNRDCGQVKTFTSSVKTYTR